MDESAMAVEGWDGGVEIRILMISSALLLFPCTLRVYRGIKKRFVYGTWIFRASNTQKHVEYERGLFFAELALLSTAKCARFLNPRRDPGALHFFSDPDIALACRVAIRELRTIHNNGEY